MKPKFKLNLFLGTALVMAFSATASHAATRTKSATGRDLTDPAAWDALPTSSDIATWTTNSLGAGLTAATSVSWGGIAISGAGFIEMPPSIQTPPVICLKITFTAISIFHL